MHGPLPMAVARLRGHSQPRKPGFSEVFLGAYLGPGGHQPPGWAGWATSPLDGLFAPQESLIFRCHLLGSRGFYGLKPDRVGVWDSGSDLDQLQPVYPPRTLGLTLPGGSLKHVSVPGTDFPGPKWAGLAR